MNTQNIVTKIDSTYIYIYTYIYNYTYIYIHIYIDMYIKARPCSWNHIRWGGGVGWYVNVHVNLRGMLTFMWINVHLNLRKQFMLRTCGVGGGWGGMLTIMWTCRSSWCYAHEDWDNIYIYIYEYIYRILQIYIYIHHFSIYIYIVGLTYVYDDDDDDDDDPNETCQFCD